MVLVTLGISIISGYFVGLIVKRNIFNPPTVMFKDDDHYHDVASRYPLTQVYPQSYLEGEEEATEDKQ